MKTKKDVCFVRFLSAWDVECVERCFITLTEESYKHLPGKMTSTGLQVYHKDYPIL